MNANFARALTLVLAHEGGFSNHKADPGGATNKGITIATFRKWVKRDGTVEDLKNISSADVAKVYHKHYWNAVRGDDLPSGVDYAVFDYAVNSGPGRAAKALQTIVGAKVDGIIGPETLGKVKAMGAAEIVGKLCDERLAFLKRLNTWGTFGKGWSNRVAGVREDALHMVAFTAPQKPPAPAPVAPADPPKPAPRPVEDYEQDIAPLPLNKPVGWGILLFVGVVVAILLGVAWYFGG